MAIRVLIADDHPVVRSGIQTELTYHPDIEVVGEAVNGDEAVKLAETLHPDVLLLDINMPGLKAAPLVRRLREQSSRPHVLVLTAYGDLEYVLGMLQAGAEGYLLKDEDPAAIAEGIRAVSQGRTWLSSAVAASIVQHKAEDAPLPKEVLSGRELEILRLMAQGFSNTQIAERLVLAEGTVKNHVSTLYAKLGFNSRAEAVAWAWQHNLIGES